MSSLKRGSGLPSRPSEGRARRLAEAASSGGIPRPMNRAVRSDSEPTTKPLTHIPSQSRLPSRVSQASSTRQAGSKPTLAQNSKSWGSETTSPSSRSNSHTQSGSGSSTSSKSYDNNHYTTQLSQNVLRRKKTSISSSQANPRALGSSSSIPRSNNSMDRSVSIQLDRGITRSPMEINVLDVVEIPKVLNQSPVIYPELDRYRDYQRPTIPPNEQPVQLLYKLSTQDLPPPTPGSLPFSASSSQLSASPSTNFFGSPGPGPYSRDTTPTSIASQSPGLTVPNRLTIKSRQLSPAQTRPPVTRRRAGSSSNDNDSIDPHGLAAVRESLTSSSSGSTVKDVVKEKKAARRLQAPPPSPPPRKSSQQFRKNSDEEKESSLKPTSTKSRSGSTAGSPQKPLKTSSTDTTARPAAPPRRPSREGASGIQSGLLSPARIIHSNLSSTSLPGDRRGSESKDRALPHQHAKTASTSQLLSGREGPSASKIAVAGSNTKRLEVRDSPRPSRSPSPGVGSSFRFPFFGRKKGVSEGNHKEKEKKPAVLRKGPAAGTGHEGYGRLGGVRRRSGSSNLSRGITDTQASQESLVSNDAFFAERMNPVVIFGGAVVENRNTSAELSRTESNQSLAIGSSSNSRGGSRITMWPSAGPHGPHFASTSRRPSESSDSEGPAAKSNLAMRRSVQRLRSSPENPLRLPQPINTRVVAASPMTSFDTSIMSDESYLEIQRETSRGRDPTDPAPKKLSKRTRSPRKWNLFGRSQKQTSEKDRKVTAAVKSAETKPVAFYTIMDSSEPEESQGLDIQDVLWSADVYSNSPKYLTPEMPSSGFQNPEYPPSLRSASPQWGKKVYHDPSPLLQLSGPTPRAYPPPPSAKLPPIPIAALSSGRPSRLQQVGRIPKVVSKRQEQNASPKSFSRPFRASFQLGPQPVESLDHESIAKGPSPPVPSTPEPDLTMEGSTAESGTNLSSSHFSGALVSPEIGQEGKEFLQFSPRKDSEGTICTSSSSGVCSFIGATAVIPKANDPPAEDEIWDEYNDLLLEDNSKPPLSATSSKGKPFHLETHHSRLVKEKPMESPTIVMDSRKASTYSLAPTRSSCYSADMTERIQAAFQPHPSPTVPLFTSDAETYSGERSDSQLSQLSEKKSVPELGRHNLSPIPERDSTSSYNSSNNESPLAQVNLRVGSMTVSKWLTFGHVLFSDVRHELVLEEGSPTRHSILVIDGLGNDDWSFYAAETYPAATFFNLSPRAPLPELPGSPSSFPLSPPNHHQIQYVSPLDKFPFAPQSFTSVVYRFPVAAPEAHTRNILKEARRVLKPGGYLELSILDVDLNNMGTHGRRAVRHLKERIHEKTPETNLASTADLMVRQIGKAGFYSIKAARVGVPVALPIPSTQDRKEKRRQKGLSSLSAMMSDNSVSGDENITKMVARVGRWWYTRCYESTAASTTQGSIWNDKALLQECEELGTSFKLMVCCGRAPDRVLSV